MPFKQEFDRMNLYISENYPDSWQGELARLRYVLHNSDQYSDETIDARIRWIDFVENNNILNNRHYRLFSKHRDYEEYFATFVYGDVEAVYLHRCEESAKNGLLKNGKIPSEALENFNKHRDFEKIKKEKYPLKYTPMKLLPRCYELIKEHAPEHYVDGTNDKKEK